MANGTLPQYSKGYTVGEEGESKDGLRWENIARSRISVFRKFFGKLDSFRE
jgi:hypothetical protein